MSDETEYETGGVIAGGSSVETAVQRLIAAAERGGYKRAIAALRDEARYGESLATEGTKP